MLTNLGLLFEGTRKEWERRSKKKGGGEKVKLLILETPFSPSHMMSV